MGFGRALWGSSLHICRSWASLKTFFPFGSQLLRNTSFLITWLNPSPRFWTRSLPPPQFEVFDVKFLWLLSKCYQVSNNHQFLVETV